MLVTQKNEGPRESQPAPILHREDKQLDRERVREVIRIACIDCANTAVEMPEGAVF